MTAPLVPAGKRVGRHATVAPADTSGPSVAAHPRRSRSYQCGICGEAVTADQAVYSRFTKRHYCRTHSTGGVPCAVTVMGRDATGRLA